MYGNNYRNSSLAAEEIQVLKAISRVSARLAQKLAALDNQRQTKEGGNRNVKTGGYGYGHTGRRNRQMTAKQYLSQAYRLNERINSDLSELDKLRDLATSLSGVNYDGVRVSKTRSTEAPFENTICKIIDAERKIIAEIDRLVNLKAEISEAISQLANVDEQLLLRFRYINNYGWEKIAVLMIVSMRTVHRIHASALRNFQPPA